jgi:hypothetical protein
MDFPKRLIQRGGVSLPSWEQPHIYKDPPKSIMTRKKERVSEADTLWNIRPDGPSSDPTRINEAISYISKGTNPSVGVNYQGFGAGGSKTNHLPQRQAGSIYKVEVVRPPLNPAEALLPLSRPRIHQTKSVETNPGSALSSYSSIANDIDRTEIHFAVSAAPSAGPRTVQATSYYKLEAPSVMSAKWAVNERPNYSTLTNPGMTTDMVSERGELRYNTNDRANYSANTNPGMKTDKLNARENPKHATNERTSYSADTNPGLTTNIKDLVSREESPYGTIIRPKYSLSSALKLGSEDSRNDDASNKVKSEVLLKSIRPNYQLVIYDPANHVSTEVSSNLRQKEYMAIQASLGKPIILDRSDGSQIKLRDYNWTAVQTNAGVDQVILTIENPEIQLERNVPLYSAASAVSLPSDTLSRKNLDYNLEGKLAVNAQTNMDLSTIYNQESLRDGQDRTYLDREITYNNFDNQTGYIPSYERTDVNTRMRDMSRQHQVGNDQYARTVSL